MSARSEELEGLREGEPADGAAAGPDEAALLEAGDVVTDSTDSTDTTAAEPDDEPEVAAHATDTAAEEAEAEEAAPAEAPADKPADALAKTTALPIYTEKPESTADKPAATADPARTTGDIRRRKPSTAKSDLPRKRDHGLPKYVEPRAEPASDESDTAAPTVPTPAAPAGEPAADRPARSQSRPTGASESGRSEIRPTGRSGEPAAADRPARSESRSTGRSGEPAADRPARSEGRSTAGASEPARSESRSTGRSGEPAAADRPARAESRSENRPTPESPSTPEPPTPAMAAEAAAVAASGVAQDVADETARAVAEAAGDSAADRTPTKAPATTAKAQPDSTPDFSSSAPPAKRDRHTFLYGRGRRVLPWRHKSRLAAPQRRRRAYLVRSIWACVLVCFATVGWSVGKALTAPGTDTIQVRLAEWGRDHGLGGVVSTLEKWQYDLNPPKKGGTVDQSQFADLGPTTEPVRPSATKGKPGGGTAQQPAGTIAMRPPLAAPAGLTLEPGEGVFHPAVSTPDDQPIIQLARIRPDAVYTSVTEDVLWIDQKHTRYVLHPGHEGGVNKQVPVPNQINPDARPNLIALFNGGFKISESHGGYFDHGVTVAPLADGAASEVIFADGHMSVGMWGRDFSFAKNPGIVTVRQNLKLMVDDGKVVPYIDDAANWGRSDHGSAAVWRSGVGVTAAGDIVYVAGNDLTAPALADLLQRAGALHAMQLDINLRWADFQYFPDRDGNPETSKLYGDFLQGATKFFYDSTKDFMAVYLR